ncbi:MAG: cob(I)yrinic acid a,c-diamide adenosyltransferase [Phycisphaeraceae bacterium]|nr:cob(I)yrinic acid a,c-diamide adenosyltransferase [Phycisphaeraceae bacterium]
MQKGFVQVYTGNGKGKTTAALGLALRAAGAGMRVFIAQFAKGMDYSELHAIRMLSGRITLRQYGAACFIDREPSETDIQLATHGFQDVQQAVRDGQYDLIILDEANIGTYYKLFSVEELLELIDARPAHVELVLTGRYADPRIIDRADLVTEMREIKHYYRQGVTARPGIEN